MNLPVHSFAAEIDGSLTDAPDLRRTAVFILLVILVAFGGFGGWAAVAEINSAAQAGGIIVVASHRKVVQHLEGGIVRRLLVAEGDMVQSGQVLMELDPIRAGMDLAVIRLLVDGNRAKLARLEAELAEMAILEFPAELQAKRREPEIARILVDQQELFHARRTLLEGQRDIQRQQMLFHQSQIRHNEEQARANDRQSTLVQEEIDSLAELVSKGYVTKTRMLALQRTRQELLERRAALAAAKAQATDGVTAARIALENIDLQFRREVTVEIDNARTELNSARERLSAAQDVVQRLKIVAPQAGKVVNLKVFTEGAVIRAGDPLMEIVPQQDELLVEVQVSPMDIDVVTKGLPANVRLTALKQRNTPLVEGEVIDVSGDRLTNERGDSYYLARLRFTEESLARVPNAALYPGMPVQAYIITGSRTALRYLLAPLADASYGAFREQ